MTDEPIKPGKPTLANLTRRVRLGRERGVRHPGVRVYDRDVKFISLKNSMDLRTVVKGRPPLGG